MNLASGIPRERTSRWRAEPCCQLSRRPAAVLHLIALRRGAAADLIAFRSPRRPAPAASGPQVWITNPIEWQDQGRPAQPAMWRMPGAQAHLILGAVQPGPGGPSASRPSGKHCNRCGYGYSGVLGQHVGSVDRGIGGGIKSA
jgi:hypothetical protein